MRYRELRVSIGERLQAAQKAAEEKKAQEAAKNAGR